MEGKKLLIVGIDPGMTTAYAVIDIEGRFIAANSSKQLELNSIISKVIGHGKVALVGTDKAKVPGMVEAFASKFGARVIHPNDDLKVDEKRRLVRGFGIYDEHQADALAAAIYAFRETKALRDKIDFFIRENKKQEGNRIRELVIMKGFSIRNAARMAEAKGEDEKIIEGVISERKLEERDFLRLYEKMKRYESEIKIMRDYNNNLRNRLETLGKRPSMSLPRETKKDKYREERLAFYEGMLKSKNREISGLKSAITGLGSIISDIGRFIILKKLNSLSLSEFNLKSRLLKIQRNDILLVDDPCIWSQKVIDALKENVSIIVHRNALDKRAGELPFIFVSAKNLDIREYGNFCFVDRKVFETEKSRINWARKIVEDYKREKEMLR